MSRNVYVSNTIHTTQPNVRNILNALHQVFEMNVRFRRRVICRRSLMGVGARDDEHESESDEHISLRFRLTLTTVPPPVNASSSFRLRIFLPPAMADDLLLTSLLIGRVVTSSSSDGTWIAVNQCMVCRYSAAILYPRLYLKFLSSHGTGNFSVI